MSTIEIKTVKANMGGLFEKSPYPDLRVSKFTLKAREYEDEKLYVGYGNVSNHLPYGEQDDYESEIKERDLKQIILENDKIKAVFLPEYGCRLISIYNKEENRELLYNNKSIRFADVALRNAWFAGGVEWNMGMRGHTPFTCDNVFCEIIETQAAPMLRFYEWERVRKAWYEIYAYLPDGSDKLYLKMRIVNSSGGVVPMYWWSNIAVRETLGTRVVTNADEAYVNDYGGFVERIPIPNREHGDISYSARSRNAYDYFFRTYDDKQKFVLAADESGYAMYQTSTDRLKGRKLFLWGMGKGGRNWQRRLCGLSDAYIEVQAGLARTQNECLPMEKDEQWEWLEVYGLTKVNTDNIFSPDWNRAKQEAAQKVENAVNRDEMQKILGEIKKLAENGKGRLVHEGSAWASLENKREKNDIFGEFADIPLGREQKPWLDLLETGAFVQPENVFENPAGYMSQKEWIPLLEKAAGDNWYAHFHLGILYYASDNYEKAGKEFELSAELKENPWALYCLAETAYSKEEFKTAFEYIMKAWKYREGDWRILKKLFRAAAKTGKYAEFLEIYNRLDDGLKNKGRVKSMAAEAYLETGDTESCEKIILSEFTVDDIREGELTLDELWVKYCVKKYFGGIRNEETENKIKEKYPAPYWLSYAMKA